MATASKSKAAKAETVSTNAVDVLADDDFDSVPVQELPVQELPGYQYLLPIEKLSSEHFFIATSAMQKMHMELDKADGDDEYALLGIEMSARAVHILTSKFVDPEKFKQWQEYDVLSNANDIMVLALRYLTEVGKGGES